MDQTNNSVTIAAKDFAYLRSYSKAPYQVEIVLNCAFILLGMDILQSYEEMKEFLMNDTFRQQLAIGLKIEDVTPVQFNNAKEIIQEYRSKIFDKTEMIKCFSNPLGLIADWIMMVYSKLLIIRGQED